jgi:hypothetical protein
MYSENIHFDHENGQGRLAVSGQLSLEAALNVVTSALEAANVRNVETLIVDLTGVSLTHRMSVIDCHYAGGCLAHAGRGLRRIAFLTRGECLAKVGFLFTVAANRGLRAAFFSEESEALGWLSPS